MLFHTLVASCAMFKSVGEISINVCVSVGGQVWTVVNMQIAKIVYICMFETDLSNYTVQL